MALYGVMRDYTDPDTGLHSMHLAGRMVPSLERAIGACHRYKNAYVITESRRIVYANTDEFRAMHGDKPVHV